MTANPSSSLAEKPSGTSTPFPPPTGAQILRALRAAAFGYAWLLLGAIVMMVLIVVAANVGSTGDQTGVDSDDTNAIGVLIGMPFQIAAMALLGSLHFTEAGVSGSLFLPPLALTVVYLLMTARAGSRGGVVADVGTRAVLAVIVGFIAAVIVLPVTWALAMRAEGAAVHAASVSLFFGAWVLTGAASYAGTSRAASARRPAWIPSDYAVAARVWASSVMVWVVVAGVVVTLVAAVTEGLWVGILVPLWGVTVGLYTYALGHLGGLSFGGETISIGDFSAVWTIVTVVSALALALMTSIAWHLRRDTRDASLSQPGSWAVLPATYAVGGLLLWLVPSVVLGGALGTIGGSATLQPAFWLVFVLMVWGAVVELASRFVAPSLATALPPRLSAMLRGPEPAEAATTPETVASREPLALTPEERARYKKIGIIAGAVAAIGIAGSVAVEVINSQVYGPEHQAAAYLDSVVDGDLDQVNDLAPTDDQADDSLLTSDVYRAAQSRITGYEIGDVEEDGDAVTVAVRLEGLDSAANTELTLTKDDHTGVFFDKWRVAEGGLARMVSVSVPDGADNMTVNDVPVDPIVDDVWLLPGSYSLDPYAGDEWLDSSAEPFTVTAQDEYQYAEVPQGVASDAFRKEVQSQIDDYLSACMASTELEPENCPNTAYAGTDVRNVSWTLDQAPTADFDSFDGTFPADLGYGESGLATVTYQSDASYGFGPRDWQPQTEESDLYLSSITVTEEDGSLVVSISE